MTAIIEATPPPTPKLQNPEPATNHSLTIYTLQKPCNSSTMGPKKGGAKDAKASGSKTKEPKESKDDKKKLKPATSINVFVPTPFLLPPSLNPLTTQESDKILSLV
jgi:Single-stranded DNA binding protein, SSDP